MNKYVFALGCASLLCFSGCSGESDVPKKQEEKPQAITGQSALWKMYQVARTSWAPDAQILKVNSIPLPEVKAERGKSGAWQAVFASTEKGRSKPYTFSVIESEGNLHKGVFGGIEEAMPPGASPFPIAAVRIDTDAAYKTAAEKAVDYEKKNPGKPISLLLEKDPKHNEVAWRVIWGDSPSTSNFSVFVGADTGTYLETMH